jgi:transcriptional regulator with PAS, ATPase and Fis domain/DNA-binding LacI/PurR family transcriptional regulator
MMSYLPIRSPNLHLTIVVFNKPLDNTVHQLQWLGGVDAARKFDVNLVYFPGDSLRIPEGFRGQANVLYELAQGDALDGLIVFAEALDPYIEPEDMEMFIRRFQSLPIVSVETAFAAIPAILMNNYQAMRTVMVHLIEDHGCRRIAFIRGPEHHFGAQERYRAYTETLTEYNLPVDSNLVTPPAGFTEVGTTITVLLDERNLRPQTDFDAVVGVNDAQAIGTISILQARGIRVPEEVAVTGFDDFEAARAISPPLTTVRPPFYEMGWQAVEMIVALLVGKEISEQTTVPMELVIRQSCGCQSQAERQAAAGMMVTTGESFETALIAKREALLVDMIHTVGASKGVTQQVEQLLDMFVAEVTNRSSGVFFSALKEGLRQRQAADGHVAAWQNVLSVLRRSVLPDLDEAQRVRAEDLWQQARVIIGETAERVQAYQTLQAEQQAQTLHTIGTALLSTFEMIDLMNVLAEELPRLGIPGCYLSLYENPEKPVEWSRLQLAYSDHTRIDLEPEGRRFFSHWLAPQEMFPQQRQYAIVVEPFYFREKQIDSLCLRWEHGAEIMTKDSQTFWSEIEQTGIIWNSQPALLLTIRDITDRKLREQRLEQERARLEEENLSLKSSIKERYRFGALVGKSPAIQRIYELIVSAATSDVNVLISGESGTGKELIACTLHQVSRRKARTFVPVNCASIPETLFEREFFGHHKGAFTGADRDMSGLFDRAHRGTLFLDEVTELTPGMQAKLLRVLQDGEYTPLGSFTSKQADVLIVAATNKDCREEIQQGRLRKDFFYRIGVIEIQVPPLRERKDDLPLLIEAILEEYRQKQAQVHEDLPRDLSGDQTMLPGEIVQALYTYNWPGNVRELQNVLQRYLATRDSEAILSLLGRSVASYTVSDMKIDLKGMKLSEVMKTLEKRILAEILAQNDHRTDKTAKRLGINRRTLQKKIKQYRLMAQE